MKPEVLEYAAKRSATDPLTPNIRRGAFVIVAIVALPYIVFWVVLKYQGLRYLDFWGSGTIAARPVSPRAIPLLGFAKGVACTVFPSLFLLLTLLVFVCYRVHKRRAFEWTFDFALVVLCIFLTYEYLSIGAYLAGV